MFHCQMERSWFVQKWAPHSSFVKVMVLTNLGTSRSQFVLLPKPCPYGFPQNGTVHFLAKSLLVLQNLHVSSFFTIFHSAKKNVQSLLVFKKKLCFKRELVTSYINLEIGLKYLESLERLIKKRINTWFNMVQTSLFVERTMPWFKKILFCWFHGSPLSTTWDPSCRFRELHGCREHGRETGAPSCHWTCLVPEETGCISLCDRNMARSDLCKKKSEDDTCIY